MKVLSKSAVSSLFSSSLAITLVGLWFGLPSILQGAGVTIITHGFQATGDLPKWTGNMAQAVGSRVGSPWQDVTLYSIVFEQSLLRLPTTKFKKESGPDPRDSITSEIVIVVLWNEFSSLVPPYSTKIFAEIVDDLLLNSAAASGLSGAVAELPLHLIGHSRGASLVSELAGLLALRGVWVDQVTLLDPHRTAADPEVFIYDNIVFADNYFEIAETSALRGASLSETFNYPLDYFFRNDGIFRLPTKYHEHVHTWYHGTIDQTADEVDGQKIVRSKWYPTQDIGFQLSRIAQGEWLRKSSNFRDGLAAWYYPDGSMSYNRTPAPRGVSGLWPNIVLENQSNDRSGNWTVEHGRSLQIHFTVGDEDSSCKVSFLTDNDLNPYNAGPPSNSVLTETLSSSEPNRPHFRVLTWTPGFEHNGRYLYAKVSDDQSHVRYHYLPRQFWVTPRKDEIKPPEYTEPPITPPVPPRERGNHLVRSSELRWDDPSAPDRDSVPESGERVTLQIHLRNDSNQVLTYAKALLSTADPSVTIIAPDVVYGYLQPGESSWSGSYFEMQLNFSSQRTVPFKLYVTYGVDGKDYFQEWDDVSYTFYPQGTFGPKFEFARVEYVDSTGNPNPELDSGEGGGFHVYIKNVGTAVAKDITATIRNAPGFIQIHQQAVDYPDLPANSGEAKGKVNSRFTFSSHIPYAFAGLATADLVIKVRGQPVEYVLEDLPLFQVKGVPWVGVTPGRYDFAVVPSKSDVAVAASVLNAGSADLHVSGITTSAADTVWSGDPLPWTIPPGHSKAFQVGLKMANLGGLISREVIVASDGRRSSSDSPANKLSITGFVSDLAPPFRLPGETAVESGQVDVDISGDTVVWTDHRNGNWDIYAFDLRTGKEIPICTNPATQSRPRISGNLVAWTDSRNARGRADAGDIYGYDFVTKQEFLISDDPQDDELIGVDRGLVAFIRDYFVFTETSNWRSARNLFIYDHATRTAKNLTGFSANQTRSPMGNVIDSGRDNDFGGGLLVWSENTLYYRTDVPNAYWDSRDQKTRLFRVGIDQQPIEANNASPGGARSADQNRFVFRKGVDNDEQISLWDNGTVRQITTERWSHAEEVLAFSGNFIIYDVNKQTRPGLYLYDLSTSQESLLTDQKDDKPGGARTDGSAVAWIRRDKTSGKTAVYVAYPQRPDISLSPADIVFSDENPTEGKSIDIAVTVHNLSTIAAAKPITVRLFEGEPRQIEGQSTSSGTSGTSQITSDAGTLALYRCEEDGTQLTDSSGNSQHGTLKNGQSRGDSQTGLGKALVFDGVDDFAELPSDLLNNRPQGTFETMVYLESYHPNGSILVSKGTANLTDFNLWIGDDGRAGGGNMGSGSGTFRGNRQVPLRVWTRITFTWDGSLWRLYIDGTLDTEVANTRVPNTSSSPLKLGHHAHSSIKFYLHGRMDEIRFSSIPQPSQSQSPPQPTPVAPVSPQPGQLGTDQVISGGIGSFGIAQVQFDQIPVGVQGTKRIYAAIYTADEENPANNLAWKELLVKDIDEIGPELFSKEVKEIPGNGNGLVDVGERARLTYQLNDPSGVGETELRLNGSLLPIKLEGTVYSAETQALDSGDYDVEIRATDKDRSPASSTHKFSFRVNPSVAVSINPLSDAAEPNVIGKLKVSRTGNTSAALPVNFTLSGTAIEGSDYAQLSRPFEIPADASSAEISIRPIPDNLREATETVVLKLESGTGYQIGTPNTASIQITDAPLNPPTISPISIPDQRTKINTDSEIISFLVGDVETPCAQLKVVAESSDQKLVPNGNIQIANPDLSRPCERQMIIRPAKDQFGTVKITVTVTDSDNLSARTSLNFEVLNDVPTVTVSKGSDAAEPNKNGGFVISRSGETSSQIVLRFSVTGTATQGVDYDTLPTSVTIPAGAQSVDLPLKVKDDLQVEGAETVIVTLAASPTYVLGTPSSASINVINDDIPPSWANRRLPKNYAPLVPLKVTIEAAPPAHTVAYGIEDRPPTGWAAFMISDGGEFDSVNGKVKWTFLDKTARTLTYQVTPPQNSSGSQCFQAGEANVNGTEKSPVGGDSCVEPVTFHPADNNPADSKLTLAEVLKYATAFKRGETWPIEPGSIPLSYVIRAFVLYKSGECYRMSSDVGSAPGWWVPCEGRPQSVDDAPGHPIAKSIPPLGTASGTAVSELPAQFAPGTPFLVRITVNPPSGGYAYGVEEKPPLGWVVSAINESGEFDVLNSKVKWTFLDSTPRTLSYQVTPPTSASGSFSFVGTANFDGVKELAVSGQRTTLSLAVDAVNRPPDRPTNLTPVSGTSNATLILSLTASAFSDPDAGDTHKASQWIVVRTEDGREIANQEATSSDLTTATVFLPAFYATTYEWKVRYKDNHDAWSDYSDPTTFTTHPKPEPPVITRQPENQSVAAGGNAVFSVTVSGSTPLTFQWRRNGQPIAGATASILELNNVQGVDQGDYDVVVANSLGNVSSQIAKLTVSSGPSNDDFANRTFVSGAILSAEGSNVEATKQMGEPNHAGKPAARSLWWSWTAPGTGNAEISTKGSAIDTVLAVYTGTSISNLESIAHNDDDPSGGSTSRVTFRAKAGIEYQIVIDAFGGEVGAIKLSIVSDLGRPPLQALLSGKNIVLSWPNGAPGFTLEASDSLDSGAWKPVAITPVSVGESQSVKLPVSEKIKFYRIRKQ